MQWGREIKMGKTNLLIVTGLSGAGKSLAVNALEDIGFYCMDNIPAELLGKLMEFALQGGKRPAAKLAVVLDSRGITSAQDMKNALSDLQRLEIEYRILFLDANQEVLERRYKETRRRHPLCMIKDCSLEEALQEERRMLAPMYEAASYRIDTTLLTTAQLKERVIGLFEAKSSDAMVLTVMSFGFKYGMPREADVMFDVRCLPNPYYVPELKGKTGLESVVSDYVLKFDVAKGLLERLKDLLAYSLPLYVKEGKSQLTVAVGCTGGKHRSVTFAKEIAQYLQECGYRVQVQHRDIQKHT